MSDEERVKEIRERTWEEIQRAAEGDLDGDLETDDADGNQIPRIPVPIPWSSRWRERLKK